MKTPGQWVSENSQSGPFDCIENREAAEALIREIQADAVKSSVQDVIFIIAYRTRSSGGHGEGSGNHTAIIDPSQIGWFASREEASHHLEAIRRLYHDSSLQITEIVKGVHRTR